MIDSSAILRDGQELRAMPPMLISERDSDVFVTYNQDKTRLDRIAGEIYGDDTFWRFILWANPEYFIEFDIPNNTQIRVPAPFDDVRQEVISKIQKGKDREIV